MNQHSPTGKGFQDAALDEKAAMGNKPGSFQMQEPVFTYGLIGRLSSFYA
ncbi:MAG: hypothetical protein ACUBOA_05310 [Candidatus Loosdrechtia sp.]|nr:MAG: hypothetical protein QY305_12370 [Candidatus Jettenia sp. AMX2]